jgi:HEAT repeat protein
VPIRKSSAASIDALTADLASPSAVTREAAVARLTVIGPRAVESLVSVVGRTENGPTARLAALRALEALGDERALNAALQATLDADAGVAAGAVALARLFLKSRRDPAVLDRLTTIALDRARPEAVRLAAVSALTDLKAETLRPLLEALAKDPVAAIRDSIGALAGPARPQAEAPAADQLQEAAEAGLPDDPERLRRLLTAGGTAASLQILHRIIERLREREAGTPAAARSEWTRARGTAHVALARRSSRVGLYDLREALEAASTPLPVEFLAALSIAGDSSCLEAIASAHERATDTWWREHLAETFKAIVAREGLTRRHAVMKKIEKRRGGLPMT